MKLILEERRRFLTALVISVVFHGVLLVVLGFWSLSMPPSPELPPPLTVTITPQTAVAEKSIVRQKDETAAEPQSPPRTAEKPPAKAVEKAPEMTLRKTEVPQPEVRQKPSPKAVVATPAEEDTDSQFYKDLAAAESSSVPSPPRSSSEIVYDDTAPKTEKNTAVSKDKAVTEAESILSGKEVEKIASAIDSSSHPADSAEISESGSISEKTETSSVYVPENATLLLDRGNSNRKPISPLDINISKETLSKLNHDGSVTVEFTLSSEGRIMDASEKRSSVSADIVTEVLNAVRRWSFTPDPGAGSITGEITVYFKVNQR